MLEALIARMRGLPAETAAQQPSMQQDNLRALAALASDQPSAGAGLHALLTADAACVTPHIKG